MPLTKEQRDELTAKERKMTPAKWFDAGFGTVGCGYAAIAEFTNPDDKSGSIALRNHAPTLLESDRRCEIYRQALANLIDTIQMHQIEKDGIYSCVNTTELEQAVGIAEQALKGA